MRVFVAGASGAIGTGLEPSDDLDHRGNPDGRSLTCVLSTLSSPSSRSR
jgi:hypothetical protein